MQLIIFLIIFGLGYMLGQLNAQEKKDGTNDCKY